MPPPRDPYRTLGLPPGATLIEVKRAYRRLAKINHPDVAGEAAVPRFLAIREAYEALTGDRVSGRGVGGSAQPGRASAADPDRARSTREAWRSRAGRRPGGDGGGGEGSAGAGPAAGARERTRRERRRPAGDRPPDRATPGSTSYDFAEHDPLDPEWTGASWYGQSSGTYWTINPKEYADPRKHGPEYQARARRRWSAEPEMDAEAPTTEAGAGAPPDPPPPGPSPSAAAGRSRPVPPPPPPGEAQASAAADGRTGERAAVADPFDPLASVPLPVRPRSRVALALIGWPPLGLGLAAVIGEISGCGRFSATCIDTFAAGTWLGQLILLLVLLAVPALAAVAAVGTLAVLAAAVPVAVLLSAVGGSRDPGNAATVLIAALVIAWLAGVGIAVARRVRGPRSRTVPP